MVEVLIFFLIFMSTLLVVGIIVSVLFLLTINRTLKLVSHEFRKISPSLVWFCLIPLFGIFFAIWMVQAVAASLRRQFEELGQGDSTVSYGLAAGRVWLYLIVAAEVILVAGYVFDYSDFAGLACNLMLMISFVSWIVYWVQISKFGRQLRKLRRFDYSPEELDYVDDLEPDRDER